MGSKSDGVARRIERERERETAASRSNKIPKGVSAKGEREREWESAHIKSNSIFA